MLDSNQLSTQRGLGRVSEDSLEIFADPIDAFSFVGGEGNGEEHRRTGDDHALQPLVRLRLLVRLKDIGIRVVLCQERGCPC
jgi:hypothetical protein